MPFSDDTHRFGKPEIEETAVNGEELNVPATEHALQSGGG
jgi:hypothetical protein